MSKAYYRVHNIFSDKKRKEMIELANKPGANIIACANIIGITPDEFNFKGI